MAPATVTLKENAQRIALLPRAHALREVSEVCNMPSAEVHGSRAHTLALDYAANLLTQVRLICEQRKIPQPWL